jgi:hypothetical protein
MLNNACVASVNDKTHKNNKFILRNAFVTAKGRPLCSPPVGILPFQRTHI